MLGGERLTCGAGPGVRQECLTYGASPVNHRGREKTRKGDGPGRGGRKPLVRLHFGLCWSVQAAAGEGAAALTLLPEQLAGRVGAELDQ